MHLPVSGTLLVALPMVMRWCRVRRWCRFSVAAFETAKREKRSKKFRSAPLDGRKKWQIDFNLFSPPCQSLEICLRWTASLNLKWIQNGVTFLATKSFQSICVLILPRHASQYRFEVGHLSRPHNFDPGTSDCRPLTLAVICLHGAVIYQQGRQIGVAITQTGTSHTWDASLYEDQGGRHKKVWF